MIKFDRGIPVPAVRKQGDGYGLRFMQPGDSKFIAGKRSSNLTATGAFMRRNPGWKFTSRNVVENGVKGCRYWCVSRGKDVVDGTPVRKMRELPVSRQHRIQG